MERKEYILFVSNLTGVWVQTFLSSSHLGKDAEGARLGGTGPRVPVLSVLNQALLACITHGGGVTLRFHNRFPVQQGENKGVLSMSQSLCFQNVKIKSSILKLFKNIQVRTKNQLKKQNIIHSHLMQQVFNIQSKKQINPK